MTLLHVCPLFHQLHSEFMCVILTIEKGTTKKNKGKGTVFEPFAYLASQRHHETAALVYSPQACHDLIDDAAIGMIGVISSSEWHTEQSRKPNVSSVRSN